MTRSTKSFKDKLVPSMAQARAAATQQVQDANAGRQELAEMMRVADDALAGRVGGLSTPKASAPVALQARPETTSLPPGEGGVLELPIEKVHDNPYNARRHYVQAVIEERAASIASDGQKTPVLVAPHPTIPGEYVLVAGHYRKRALQWLKRPTIRGILHPEWNTSEDLYLQSWRENAERLEQSPLDNASQWTKVLADGVFATASALADKLGVSPNMVSKTLALARLPEGVVNKARDNAEIFSLTMLYELALFAKDRTEDKTLELMEIIEKEGWSRKKLEEYRAKLENAGGRKAKEFARGWKIDQEGSHSGQLKEWDNGRILLDVTVQDPALREGLVAVLRKQFGLEPDASLRLTP